MKKFSLLVGSACFAVTAAVGMTAVPSSAFAAVATAQVSSTLSTEELDNLLAPIALYPDPLLAQVLMASTYPLQVVEAERWAQNHPGLSGAALDNAVNAQDWDPSVKSLVYVPRVLQEMSSDLDWTQNLGNAVGENQAEVMDRVQLLRRKARAAGNLRSNDQQVVTYATETGVVNSAATQAIVIQPRTPDYIYVPVYDPIAVYGNWWWPSRPHYWRPPYAPAAGSLFFWGNGIRLSLGLWGGFSWGHGYFCINEPVYRRWYHRAPPRFDYHYAPRAGYVWWRPQHWKARPGIHRPAPHGSFVGRPATLRSGFAPERRDARPGVRHEARPQARHETRPAARQNSRPQMRQESRPQMRQNSHPQMRQESRPQTRQESRPQMRQESRSQMHQNSRPQMRQESHVNRSAPSRESRGGNGHGGDRDRGDRR